MSMERVLVTRFGPDVGRSFYADAQGLQNSPFGRPRAAQSAIEKLIIEYSRAPNRELGSELFVSKGPNREAGLFGEPPTRERSVTANLNFAGDRCHCSQHGGRSLFLHPERISGEGDRPFRSDLSIGGESFPRTAALGSIPSCISSAFIFGMRGASLTISNLTAAKAGS